MKLLSNQVTFIIELYVTMPKYRLDERMKSYLYNKYFTFSNPVLNLLHTHMALNNEFDDNANGDDIDSGSFTFNVKDYIEPLLKSKYMLKYSLKKLLEKFNVNDLDELDKKDTAKIINNYIKNKYKTDNIIFIKILWRYFNKIINIPYSKIIIMVKTLNHIDNQIGKMKTIYEKCDCGFNKCKYKYKFENSKNGKYYLYNSNCNYAADIIINDIENNTDGYTINSLVDNNNPKIVKYLIENKEKITDLTDLLSSDNYSNKILKNYLFENLDKISDYSTDLVFIDNDFIDYALDYGVNMKSKHYNVSLGNNNNKRIVDFFQKYGYDFAHLINNFSIWIPMKTYYTKNVIGEF